MTIVLENSFGTPFKTVFRRRIHHTFFPGQHFEGPLGLFEIIFSPVSDCHPDAGQAGRRALVRQDPSEENHGCRVSTVEIKECLHCPHYNGGSRQLFSSIQ
jgi:hypothetical protein